MISFSQFSYQLCSCTRLCIAIKKNIVQLFGGISITSFAHKVNDFSYITGMISAV